VQMLPSLTAERQSLDQLAAEVRAALKRDN